MAEFIEIKTQEEFDKRISERLDREREKIRKEFDGHLSPEEVAKKYEGFMSEKEVQEKYKGFMSPNEVAKKDNMIHKYELEAKRTKIAMESGIPFELASKISGETEEDMKKDAETLKGFINTNNNYPRFTPPGEGNKGDEKKEALKQVLAGMKGE